MKVAVIQFPGSNSDQDAVNGVRVIGHQANLLWHKEESVGNADAVIVPGGFSYGDYLRCGAIARFSPVMQAVKKFAAEGGPILGICNGFQVLCEAALLPGALVRNRSLQFRSEHVYLKTIARDTPFTGGVDEGRLLRVPIAHGEGCYFADEEALAEIKANNQILWQYVDQDGNARDDANPNGSLENIAGICNKERNVAGLMPHPERACEEIIGSADGRAILESMANWLESKNQASAA